jgi:choline-sulfatase
MKKPNILFLMTDQQRYDTIAALGNEHIYTPNLDRLVARGLAFENAYSSCPVCVAARCNIRTGREPPTTRVFSNRLSDPAPGQKATINGRCGPYLAEVMAARGYRTFGVGKFHPAQVNEDLGYETRLKSEEMYGSPAQRANDDYASWIASKHPDYNFIEGLMGERTEMYYMPQMSPMPAEATVERWAADRAVEQIRADGDRSFFGFVSFIGPHPPFAPPIPYNRMYDPDRMPNPITGNRATDHADEQIPWMNEIIWAESINEPHARILKARYYGEISYIDNCIGHILDAVEERTDAGNTLICFFSDHGDHLGDHQAWQKESFFEASCHVPFLLSWPDRQLPGAKRKELVCLTDLFGIATHAAGRPEIRDGVDVLAHLANEAAPREVLAGFYGEPGTPQFKLMVRKGEWKYIYLANGGREQLFNLQNDPHEIDDRTAAEPEIRARMRSIAIGACSVPGARAALDGADFLSLPYHERPRKRIYQFDGSRGVTGFPGHPSDVLDQQNK